MGVFLSTSLTVHRCRGIIVGGDTTCTQSEAWISAMSVDSLSRGRHQPFYQCAVPCSWATVELTSVKRPKLDRRVDLCRP